MDLHQNPAYHSSQLTYFGCFKNTFNDLDRMLFEGTYNNFRNNTPDWCVAYCTTGGFEYAGLQYGSQCICTNSGPQGTSDAGQCTYGCAGDSSIKMCGGLGYINIFHTDAHKTTIDDWGCGNTVQDTYYQKWYDDMGHCGITPGGGGASGGNGAPTFKSKNTSPYMMIPYGDRPTFVSLEPHTNPLPACMQGEQVNFGMPNRQYTPIAFVNPDDGMPVVCSGSGSWKSHPLSKDCEKFNATENTWHSLNSNIKYGGHMKSLVFDADFGLFAVGGSGGWSTISKKVERSLDYGVTWEELAELPSGIVNAALVVVDKDTLFLSFGEELPGPGRTEGNVRTMNLKTNQWTSRASFPKSYNGITSCVLWETDETKEEEIYCIGANDKSVMVYNLERDEWREAPGTRLTAYNGGGLFTWRNSLMYAGGNGPADIYRWDNNGTWVDIGIDVPRSLWNTGNSFIFVEDFCP